MKLKHGIGAVLASTLLLAGCTTDKGQIKSYNEQVQKAFDKEKPVVSNGKELNKLEKEKSELVDKINGKDQREVRDTSQKIVDNVVQREKVFDKEEEALAASEKEFKKANQYIKDIGNEGKKKEVEQLNDALKAKYKAHDAHAKAYRNILAKEKDMFSYTAGEQVEQGMIDKKSEAVGEAYKTFNDKFKDYQKAMNKVSKEKQDVDSIS